MNISDRQQEAITALTRNFKCPVCGNTHLRFEDFIVEKPLACDIDSDPVKWIETVVGTCTWCGLLQEFDLNQIMESFEKMSK